MIERGVEKDLVGVYNTSMNQVLDIHALFKLHPSIRPSTFWVGWEIHEAKLALR